MSGFPADPGAIRPPDLVSFQSPQWRNVLEMARQMANSSEPVLIIGEGGTGKTQVARFIHHAGPRREKNSCHWFALNPGCGDPRTHAFGSADRRGESGPYAEGQGLFPKCDGGTILLDPAESYWVEQQKVVDQFLRDSLVLPKGASEPHSVDVRFVFVTRQKSPGGGGKKRGLLRSLWDRLKDNLIVVPPLRKRREDIRPLLAHELSRIRGELAACGRDREAPILAEAALDYIGESRLPVNGWDLRRLANTVYFVPPGKVITRKHLQELLLQNGHDLNVSALSRFTPAKRMPKSRSSDAGGSDRKPESLPHWR